MLHKTIILHTLGTGCNLLTCMVEATGIENAKIEIVNKLPERGIVFHAYKRYEIPEMAIMEYEMPIGMRDNYKKRKQENRYRSNRHNFRK